MHNRKLLYFCSQLGRPTDHLNLFMHCINVCMSTRVSGGVPRRASRPAARSTDPKTTRGEPEKPITLPLTYAREHAMRAPQNTLQHASLLSTFKINTDSLSNHSVHLDHSNSWPDASEWNSRQWFVTCCWVTAEQGIWKGNKWIITTEPADLK